MASRVRQAFEEMMWCEEVRAMLSDEELKRVKDLLSIVECSLTELRENKGFWKLLGRAEQMRFQTMAYQVAAWKLALPPVGLKC